MCPGLSANLQLMDDSRKTAIINKELARLNIDVACLQETRLADSGSLMERDYTFFWQGLSQDEPRQYVRNSLIATTKTPLRRVIENSCPLHENVRGLCEHHIRLRPDSDLHLLTSSSAGNTIRNPKFLGHIFARRFQRSRWDRLASMAYLPRPLRRRQDE